ncbi:unnamed protein product [Aureobasidium pullulans]|uniref:Uncharacterized protein n=1 Tax=Aureobasidium pullulans TaxID=5580 RepID=A0A4S8X037_AURPU|nr:hypothetical protein D6D22_09667 [Aureobasidium pullulans]THZ66476.1 hypothetical protein D6C85_08099 [Aureobasidium pullulans]CAC9892160.1 unnamed protein product [Aureobasidium pullulans]
MLSLNCSKIGTVRPSIFGPLSSFRVTHRRVHTNNDIRASILSSHPELVEESSRKRILEQYISECARLGIRQNIEIGKIRLPRSKPERFVHLKAKAIAASLLDEEKSGRLLRQYQACKSWIEKNTPDVEKLYAAEKRAVLQRFPSLVASPVREHILKQYDAESARLFEQSEGPDDQPRKFVDGTWFAERQKFAELELQCVAVHLLEDGVPSKSELEKWKNDFDSSLEALKDLSVLPIEVEREEALRRYPDLEDPEVRRAIIEDTTLAFEMARTAQSKKKSVPSAIHKNCLEMFLKALDAQALSPDGDDAKRMKLRQQHRVEALADLAELKASKKGGWWILPNPLAIMDWIPI